MALLALFLFSLIPTVRTERVKPVHTGLTLSEVLLTAGKWSDEIGKRCNAIDPNYLTAKLKMKGIKHYVEYISLLEELYNYGNQSTREFALDRVGKAIKVTQEPLYHDEVSQTGLFKFPPNVDPNDNSWNSYVSKKFRSESVSYLRACMKFERMPGFDTSYYRERIKALLPKYRNHIPRRGLIQKLAFVLLFDLLNIPHPNLELKGRSYKENMRHLFKRSTVAARRSHDWYVDKKSEPPRLYWLTHEIFEVTNLGRWEFDMGKGDWEFSMEALRKLFRWKMDEIINNEEILSVDHLCEFIMTYAMMYRGDVAVRDTNVVGLADAKFGASDPPRVFTPEDVDMLHEAMNLIMERRNSDGSFGFFFNRRHWRNKINMQLHVTSVCLRGVVLITRFPEIKDAYFTKEKHEENIVEMEVSTAGEATGLQSFDSAPTSCQQRTALVAQLQARLLEKIGFVVHDQGIPSLAQLRRIKELTDAKSVTMREILHEVAGPEKLELAKELLEVYLDPGSNPEEASKCNIPL